MDKLFRLVRFSISISAFIALVVGLSLTALLFASIRRVESERHNLQFKKDAALRIAAVTEGLGDAVEQLVVLNGLFNTMGIISREQFHTFTAPLLTRYPQIQALSFQRLVLQHDRHAYEAAMRRRVPDFMITEVVNGHQRPAAMRESYKVVEYIEPVAGNKAAFGLDTALASDLTGATQRSRPGGQALATGLPSLTRQKGSHTGILVAAPVYLHGAALDTAAARQRAVIGETAVVFQAEKLINVILQNGKLLDVQGMAISIYAGPGANEENLVFRHGFIAPGSAPLFKLLRLPRWLAFDRADPVSETFNLASSPWRMEIAQADMPFTATHNGSLYALLGGTLSTLLAAAYIYTLVSRSATIERVTAERTAALQFANLRLSEDLALRTHSEEALRLRERIIEVSPNAIIICSAVAPDYPIEDVNPAFGRITGYRFEDVAGRSLESLLDGHQDQQNLEEIRAALREQREGHALLRNYRKDGSAYWNDLFVAPVHDDHGVLRHFIVAQYDMTAVMRFEAELEFQAKHDALTGLANRNLLGERLSQAIIDAQRAGSAIWVAFVDINRFNFVNDTLGHEAGDVLLRILAGRLQSAARDADTVARVGGDEFVLVLPEHTEDGLGLAVLQRIMAAVAEPLVIDAHEFFLTCSIGVAIYPADGDSAQSLTKHADIAMYRAKEMGANSYQFYTATMNKRMLDRVAMEADLSRALERGEFAVHYQPQVSMSSGRIVGMEALLRWEHPVHGAIAPARFIGLAEEMGAIIQIGAWVLRTACIQTKAWQQAGLGELRVAVNLSSRQFTQKALVQSIADVLQTTGLEPRFLELELTEGMIMSDVDHAIETLHELKGLGIHISIDDFGTGHSSLSYLRRFPIDVLKIDKSFVNDLADADNAAIVMSIILLAHSLRLQVITEGVETAEQFAFLRMHGCDQIQGYYFSGPIGPEAFELLLREGGYLPDRTDT